MGAQKSVHAGKGSGGVNLRQFSAGEPASCQWSGTTSIKFEHVRLVNDDGRSITRDLDGFPVRLSLSFYHYDLSLQIEQGVPVLSKLLSFYRFKFVASKGIKVGTALLSASLTGGSILGDMTPYQAFANLGLGSVRGYGEGGVGTGRSCLIMNSELTLPVNKVLEFAVFLDSGTDLDSGRHVDPGNSALRHGIGCGYGMRLKSRMGQFQVDYAFQQKTVYFGVCNI